MTHLANAECSCWWDDQSIAVSSKQTAMSLLNVYRIALPMRAAGTDRNYGRLLSFVQLWESEAELDSPADDKSIG